VKDDKMTCFSLFTTLAESTHIVLGVNGSVGLKERLHHSDQSIAGSQHECGIPVLFGGEERGQKEGEKKSGQFPLIYPHKQKIAAKKKKGGGILNHETFFFF